MSVDISIVIPTWNGLHLLRENLPSVRTAARVYTEETGGATEIIVVDDGSQDDTSKVLPVEFLDVRLIRRSHNGGFAAACNAGFLKCRFPLVALLNNDVRIDEKYLIFQALHFEDPEVFAVTARVFEWDSTIFAAGGRVGRFRRGFWSVYFNYDVTLATAREWVEERKLLSAYAVGGFATYNREKLNLLGGFSELLSPFQWEDVDLSYRGWKRGWEVHYEPRSLAYHRTSATIDSHYTRSHVRTVSCRNRLLFHWVNLHSPTYLARHLLMLPLLLASRILAFDVTFYRSFLQALLKFREFCKLRAAERGNTRKTDVEISQLLDGFYRSAPIQVYYNQKEVIERHPEFEEAEV